MALSRKELKRKKRSSPEERSDSTRKDQGIVGEKKTLSINVHTLSVSKKKELLHLETDFISTQESDSDKNKRNRDNLNTTQNPQEKYKQTKDRESKEHRIQQTSQSL